MQEYEKLLIEKYNLEVFTEECIDCHGRGARQAFDVETNKWVKSDLKCLYCNGEGVRRYYDCTSPTDFVYKRHYISND
jgi:DnaJ-class molecular chaperone